MRSLFELLEARLGFATTEQAALQVFLCDLNPTLEERLQRVREIEENLERLLGVETVAMVTALSFRPHQIDAQDAIVIEERDLEDQDRRVLTNAASPDCFRAMEIPQRVAAPPRREIAGTPGRSRSSTRPRQRFFPCEDPIGRFIGGGDGSGSDL